MQKRDFADELRIAIDGIEDFATRAIAGDYDIAKSDVVQILLRYLAERASKALDFLHNLDAFTLEQHECICASHLESILDEEHAILAQVRFQNAEKLNGFIPIRDLSFYSSPEQIERIARQSHS